MPLKDPSRHALRLQGMPTPDGFPEMCFPYCHGDAIVQKDVNIPPGPNGDATIPLPHSKQTQQTKTKHTKKRLTKKEQDEAAVQRFLSSPAFTEALAMQLDKLRKSDRMDNVYKRAFKVMRQFAFLADGDPEAITEEGDLLLEYIGQITYLQCKRKGVPLEDLKEVAALNEAFSRLKHVRKK